MVTVSLCMIVKDEEAVLGRLLAQVKDLVEEIIIVDTGSTDRTKEIAGAFTPLVYDFTWQDDFAAARNYSFSLATMDYILWLDADDVLSPSAREKFRELKENLSPETDMVMFPYETAFDAQGKPTFCYYRERLIKNHQGFFWEGEVHEAIVPQGNVIYAEVPITHQKVKPADSDRNLRILENLAAKGKPLSPRHQFYYARECFYHGQYEKAKGIFETFLQNPAGWQENKIEACKQLAQCYFYLKDDYMALQSLFRSFQFAPPRAEICCDIGNYFLEQRAYQQSIFWYELATTRPREDKQGGFVLPDCYTIIPYLQLCVCYDRLGNLEKALYYHALVGKENPQHPSYLLNEVYFAHKKQQV